MAECYDFSEMTDIEIARTDKQNECRYIPPLPKNKDYHMFICYIQDDAEDVRIIVDNLEQHGLKCCYHERDFLPGQQVIGNIHESINRSMSILIVLSANFVQSRVCKHEIEQALYAKIEEDYTIIPIKIQRCEVPNVLKNYTHIDAGCVDPAEMHTKILDAFISNEWNSRQMIEINGYTMVFLPTKYTISWRWLSLYRYTMIFDAANRRSIARNGFEISDKLLDEVEQVVRDSNYIKYAHISNNFICMTTFAFAMVFLLYFCIRFTITEILVKSIINKQKTKMANDIVYGLLMIFIIWLCFVTVHWCGANGCFKTWKGMTRGFKQRTEAHLMRQLWKRINRKTVESSKFIVIVKALKLYIMRFDMKPCQNFFIRRCSVNEDLKRGMLPTESLQEYTDRLFDDYMRDHINMLLEQTSEVPGRHTIKNGAKCLCELVHDQLLPEGI